MVLFKVRQSLRLTFLDDGEVGGREAGDGLAVAAGDDHIEQDFARRDGERSAGLWRILLRLRGTLRGSLRLEGKREKDHGEKAKLDAHTEIAIHRIRSPIYSRSNLGSMVSQIGRAGIGGVMATTPEIDWDVDCGVDRRCF